MNRSAAVVVLSDLGRSPRMLNHATSIASKESYRRVDLVGQAGIATLFQAILIE